MPRIQKQVKKTVRQAKKAGTYEKGLGKATRAKLEKRAGVSRSASGVSTATTAGAGTLGRKTKRAVSSRASIRTKKASY